MTISLIVLIAALSAFDAFDAGVARTSRLTDAEDTARREVGNIVHTLRDAGAPAPAGGAQPATITRAGATDLVFVSTAWPGESGTGTPGTSYHVERYCVSTSTRTLWFDGLHAGTAGSADPGAACPSTASGWPRRAAIGKVANSAADPLFTYPAVSTAARSVGVSLQIDGGTPTRPRTVQLRSGATLRGALAPAVTSGGVTCTPDAGGKVLLSLSVATDASGGALSLSSTRASASVRARSSSTPPPARSRSW